MNNLTLLVFREKPGTSNNPFYIYFYFYICIAIGNRTVGVRWSIRVQESAGVVPWPIGLKLCTWVNVLDPGPQPRGPKALKYGKGFPESLKMTFLGNIICMGSSKENLVVERCWSEVGLWPVSGPNSKSACTKKTRAAPQGCPARSPNPIFLLKNRNLSIYILNTRNLAPC